MKLNNSLWSRLLHRQQRMLNLINQVDEETSISESQGSRIRRRLIRWSDLKVYIISEVTRQKLMDLNVEDKHLWVVSGIASCEVDLDQTGSEEKISGSGSVSSLCFSVSNHLRSLVCLIPSL
jgi:hypothetical protein